MALLPMEEAADQTFDKTSTNAQSGIAVDSAINNVTNCKNIGEFNSVGSLNTALANLRTSMIAERAYNIRFKVNPAASHVLQNTGVMYGILYKTNIADLVFYGAHSLSDNFYTARYRATSNIWIWSKYDPATTS